jgi:DNA-binding XRE family transcriptional regulator
MIRTEHEYQEALQRLAAERSRIDEQRRQLKARKFSEAEIKRVLDPIQSFQEQLVEEVHFYERIKRGEFDALENLRGLGQHLIGLRIYLGITQRQLAERLGVHESQVSRDERNEYRGVTVVRVSEILEVLHVQARTVITVPQPPGPMAA